MVLRNDFSSDEETNSPLASLHSAHVGIQMDNVIPVHLSIQSESNQSRDQSESRTVSHDQEVATPAIQISVEPSVARQQDGDSPSATSPLSYQRQASHPPPTLTMIRHTLHGRRYASMHIRQGLPGNNTEFARSVSYVPEATPTNDPNDLSETLPPSKCVCGEVIISSVCTYVNVMQYEVILFYSVRLGGPSRQYW